MIDNIKLTNFESHPNSILNFDKGLNIIIGKSDCGKSSILRALSLVAYNKPSGDSFISHWAEETNIEIDIKGNKIIRSKSKKENAYTLITENESEQYKSFGSNVPEPVQAIINFDDVNFQYQMDAPFLLSKSSGEISRYLNQVVNLSKIDQSLSEIEKLKRSTVSQFNFKEKDLQQAKEDISQYDFIEEFESDLKEAKKIECLFLETKENYSFIYSLIEDIKELDIQKKETQKKLPDINEISYIENLIIKEEDYNSLRIELQTIKNKLNVIKTSQEQEEQSIKDYQKKLMELMKDVCPLCGQEIQNG